LDLKFGIALAQIVTVVAYAEFDVIEIATSLSISTTDR
jgi:hypothetical protein